MKVAKVVPSKVYSYLIAAGASAVIAFSGAYLVAPNEGRVDGTYLDPVGIVTSCYGHTGPELKLGQTFTEEQCNKQLLVDLVKHEKQLDRVLKFPVPMYTKAALIDFTYNVGIGNVSSSTLIRKINMGNIQGGCQELTRWVYAKGRKLAGLVKRRDQAYQVCIGNVTLETVLAEQEKQNVKQQTKTNSR